MTNKQKNFYKLNEIVELKETKETLKVLELDTKTFDMKASFKDGRTTIIKFWDVRKLSKRKPTIKKTNKKVDTVLFAKVREDAIIPSKREEDAGMDVYCNLSGGNKELLLPKGKPTLVPTGIACSLKSDYYFNLKHERGSTGKVGMSVLSGVIDSGFRNEIFVNIVPLYKDVLITNKVEEVQEREDLILYPYSKAIAQGTIEFVPKMNVKEILYEDLLKIPSKRGTSMLGSSGK